MLPLLLRLHHSTTVVASSAAAFLVPASCRSPVATRVCCRHRHCRRTLQPPSPHRSFASTSSSNSNEQQEGNNNGHTHADEALLDEVEVALKGPCGVRQGGAPIVIAVSGGVDSMALLHILAQIRTRWHPPLQLQVAHFNHGLRKEADDEEAFVRQVAGDLDVPIHVSLWGEDDRTQKTGIQERARKWRRHECQKLLLTRQQQSVQKGGEGYVATAHHADDSLETWLLKFLRGAHLSHLKGMEARSSSSLSGSTVFIKPLLHIPKARLTDFMIARGLEWREDASNQIVDKYRRNRVRHQLLPLMAEIAGGQAALKTRIEELTQQSRGLEEWLEQEAQSWEERERKRLEEKEEDMNGVVKASEVFLSGPSWEPLPRLLKEEILHRFITRTTGGELDSLPYGQIRRILGQLARDAEERAKGAKKPLQWQLCLADKWVLERQGNVLRVLYTEGKKGGDGCVEDHERKSTLDFQDAQVQILVTEGLHLVWHIMATRLSPQEAAGRAADMKNDSENNGKQQGPSLILYNIPIGAHLLVRTRRDGDRFHPVWRQGPIKMKDFLRGQRVPLHRRDDVLLVCSLQEEEGKGEDVLALHPLGQVAKGRGAEDDTGEVPPLCITLEERSACHNG